MTDESSSVKVKMSVFMATSLDGYIARPDGGIDWLHEGEPLDEGDDAGYGDFFKSVDALLMGRGTFETVLGFDSFPYEDKPVIVASKSLLNVPENLRHQVRIESGTPRELVDTLSQRGYRHIYLDGGQLVQSFLRVGLVDEMTLTTIPILIGAGRPLFGTLDQDIRLQRMVTRTWANGFVQSTYRVLK